MIKVNTCGLEKVKAQIFSLKGNMVTLCVNRGRKRYDTFDCTIENIYPSVFTIKFNNKLQTFSYFDVLCGTVKVSDSVNKWILTLIIL